MVLGCRAHDFGNGKETPLHERMQLIKDAGYDTIQLAPAKIMSSVRDIHSITEWDMEAAGKAAYDVDLTVGVLGCYIEPAVSDKEERLRNVATFQHNIRMAKLAGTRVVGTETTHFPQAELNDHEAAYSYLKDSVQRMVETAEKEDVYVAVEAVADNTLDGVERTKRLLDEVGSDKLRVILDPCNILTAANMKNQKEILAQALALYGDKIVALHIKNCIIENGTKKLVSLRSGLIDFSDTVKYLNKLDASMPLLRENSKREYDKEDIAYMEEML